MNITEANAVNIVVRSLARVPNRSGLLPTSEQQQAAVDLLLRKAAKVLGAGLSPGDVTIDAPL